MKMTNKSFNQTPKDLAILASFLSPAQLAVWLTTGRLPAVPGSRGAECGDWAGVPGSGARIGVRAKASAPSLPKIDSVVWLQAA